jgi:hypothetical protein
LAGVPKNNLKFLDNLYRERATVYRQMGREDLAEGDEKQADGLWQ